ncbi:hypothetical protein BDV59DRAFT_210483 [Aspergillus ambiguus]|uniref:uncharacterized protein n=1 Tax=Aspergillus ambiguus TaxID=176160 RepID=UPI003CCD5D4A
MRPRSRNDFAIAIICALTLEAEAVEAVFDETYDRLGKYYGKQPGDANSYINGRIGKHNVVLCYMPGMGKGSAASVSSSLRISYTSIQLALVVGICGAVPSPPHSEIYLGDVIISDTVIEYDFGRQYPGGYRRKTDVKEMLGRPDRQIRTLLNGLKTYHSRHELQFQMLQHLDALQQTEGTEGQDTERWRHPGIDDILFNVAYLHKHHEKSSLIRCCCSQGDLPGEICEGALEEKCDDLGCDKDQVVRRRRTSEKTSSSIHIGTLGSADTVMKSGQHRDEIMQKARVIGFDMEGAGVWDNFPSIIIKGVCDYADSHKCKSWQAYAAATGASAAKAFLEYWPSHMEDASNGRHLMIPFGRNSRFVGRQPELQTLDELIFMSDGPKKLAITGLGGMGKTQVALELAYRMRDKDAECSIFWIPCTNYEAVEQECMKIAKTIGIRDINPAHAKEHIQAHFSQTIEKWLLIFDNADDVDMWNKGSSTTPALKDFLPYNSRGHIVFTTRNRGLAMDLACSHVIQVEELDKDTGKEFLEKCLIQKSLCHDTSAIIDLLEHLTFLPLAITQAAAYINKKGISTSEYLDLLKEQEADVVELLSEDFGDDGRYKDSQNPVAMTWLISFRQIQKLDPLAADYLSLMACVNPRSIPDSFLPQAASKKKKTDALGLLSAYSFIIQPKNKESKNCPITIHRLVHLATRNWMKREKLFPLYIRKAADRLNETFPNNDHTNRQRWREYLPHALFLLSENEFIKQQAQYIDYIHKVGNCLYSDGRYSESEELGLQVVKTGKQMLGPEHPMTLTCTADLASTYWKQGRWKEAEELQLQVLGLEHPDTLTSMNSLASTYRYQGRLKEAEELQLQVMETRKQVLGSGHPKTLTSMANLASTYENQDRWNEAEELQLQVMETRKLVLGSNHPKTLTCMNNLASTYQNQGRWNEAEELQLQVMETRKLVLGTDHPDTLTSMNNLAYTRERIGNIHCALPPRINVSSSATKS